MLTRARIVVDGLVQGVGYRYAVRAVARAHNLLGYVKNLEDGTVEIICEGERNDIRSFADGVKIVKEPIRVDKVDVTFEEPKHEFKSFRIVTGDLADEMVEGFATGSAYFNIMIGKQDQMIGKQDQMIGKQDQTIGKQDQTIGEIHGLREDMKAFLDERFRRLEREIDQIKGRLGIV
jgi:acylphosphatase